MISSWFYRVFIEMDWFLDILLFRVSTVRFSTIVKVFSGRNAWKSFNLEHFRATEFKSFFNHGENILCDIYENPSLKHFRAAECENFQPLWKYSLWKSALNSFILEHFRAAEFKIFFNHGEIILCDVWKSFILEHFRAAEF